jgi:phosphoribosylanthranilate isomerase
MHTRIKICGINEPEYALIADELGVDAIGMVFVPNAPRFVTLDKAQAISAALGPFAQSVGLFVNPTADEVTDVLAEVDLDILQFHGEEEASFCESFGLPYLKAVRVQNTEQIVLADQNHRNASALLVDSFSTLAQGGTGETFDWKMIPQISRPLVLAGGLNPLNVAAAIELVGPYAVDVSSGVESAPGIKDTAKMRAFVEAVREVVPT